MRKIIVICLVTIAVLSPLILTYVTDIPGLTELSFFEICKYTVVVTAVILFFVLIGEFFYKSKKKYLLLYEWNEREIGLAITKALQEKKIRIEPLTVDYFTIEKDGIENKLIERLKQISGAIIIIGKGSVNSPYFYLLIKTLKGKKINSMYLKISEDVVIPKSVPKNKILGTIDQVKDPQYVMNLNNILQR